MKFPVFCLVSILFGIISKTSSECVNGLEGIDGKYFLNEDVEVCCPVGCNGCGDDGCHLIGKTVEKLLVSLNPFQVNLQGMRMD